MEILFLFIFVIAVASVLSSLDVTIHSRCDQRGMLHDWVIKGEGDNTYRVCSQCKYMPDGNREEQDEKK